MPLPPGITFDASTRTLSGTPTTAGSYEITYTATDVDGDVASQTFSFVVAADVSPVAPSIDNIRVVQDQPFSETLPTGTGGDGALTYSLTGDLPDRTLFDSSTRVLSGRPSIPGTFPLVYTVEDEDGDTDTVSFSIVVEANTEPTLPAIEDLSGMVDTAITDVQLPEATGGNAPLTYTVT